MTYEAYEEPARRVMAEIASDARRRWPDLERIALHHRVGELALSEPSVAVPSTWVLVHAAAPPVGSVDVNTSPM